MISLGRSYESLQVIGMSYKLTQFVKFACGIAERSFIV